ncbi:MAG: glycosyltransferase [Pseudonocardia sp.]|nr:glycosyltransferase [Pseudonocardia sp.]
MRVLVSFVGGRGHLEPLLPLARALEAHGHPLLVTGQPSMGQAVLDAGFPFLTTGDDLGDTGRRFPLLAYDADREDDSLRRGFAGRTARRRAADVLALCRYWVPDVLICDEIDFGAMVAAERFRVPHVTVLVTAAGSFVRPGVVAPALDVLRREFGLPPDPGLAMPSRDLVVAPFPPGFRDPAHPLPPGALSIRPPGLRPGARPAPGPVPPDATRPDATRPDPSWPSPPQPDPAPPQPTWPIAWPGAPVVYATLGTIFDTESGDLFPRLAAGLGALEVNVLLTVGRHVRPSEIGRQPANVHVASFVPQAEVLPHCSAVVSHGGSGTVTGALAHGLPLVVLPLGADQDRNARRVADLGAGLVLDPLTATPAEIGGATLRVLREPGFAAAARTLADEAAALPSADAAVAPIESLVRRG